MAGRDAIEVVTDLCGDLDGAIATVHRHIDHWSEILRIVTGEQKKLESSDNLMRENGRVKVGLIDASVDNWTEVRNAYRQYASEVRTLSRPLSTSHRIDDNGSGLGAPVQTDPWDHRVVKLTSACKLLCCFSLAGFRLAVINDVMIGRGLWRFHTRYDGCLSIAIVSYSTQLARERLRFVLTLGRGRMAPVIPPSRS